MGAGFENQPFKKQRRVMSKLSELYKAMETLRNMVPNAARNIESEVSQAEEELIRDEILPILEHKIEPALREVQREVVLVVDYKPGEPIRVALSRKVRIDEMADAKLITPHATGEKIGQPVVGKEPQKRDSSAHEPTKKITNTTKGLRVTFSDGTVVCRTTAIDTFKAVLQRIGLERVHPLRIMHNGYNLVSRKMHPLESGRIFQHELDGWYIYSNISNKDKKRDLQKISARLHLNLNIEEGKPGV